ncbi:MAG: hypothetical protein NTW10_10740 [Bacteroidetes bacterium]|nr:hypothetical protein [Bacteroidota bacterium]
MKILFRLLILAGMVTLAGPAMAQSSTRALLLDSVYSYNWATSDWSLNLKNYRIKDGTGRTVQSLYKRYITGTGQFQDYIRSLSNFADAAADPTSLTNQLWYGNVWNTFQYTHYIAPGTIDTTFTKGWDNQTHRFTFGYRSLLQYNDSMLVIENLTQSWDTTSLDWVNGTKTTQTYTPEMQPLEKTTLSWRRSASAWVNSYKVSTVYDGSNLLVNQLEFVWDSTHANWVSTFRYSWYNNFASLPYLEVHERWDSTLNVWDSLTQSTYIYNPFNWLLTVITKSYTPTKGSWAESYLILYNYTAGGVKFKRTGNIWDPVHSVWAPDSFEQTDTIAYKSSEVYNLYYNPVTYDVVSGVRNLYAYTPAGDTLSKANQAWDVPGNGWANKSQVLYTYDLHNLLSETLTQTWTGGTAWDNSKKSDYYYSDFIGIGEKADNVKPCFYANPIVAGSSIYCPGFRTGDEFTLRINSLSGAVIYITMFRGGEAVSIPGSLSQGTYILVIEEKNRIVYKDKVVVLH